MSESGRRQIFQFSDHQSSEARNFSFDTGLNPLLASLSDKITTSGSEVSQLCLATTINAYFTVAGNLCAPKAIKHINKSLA